MPVTDDEKTIRPPLPWAIIWRAAAWAPKYDPFRLRSTRVSQVDSSVSRNGFPIVSPALAAKMSSRPNAATARATSAWLAATVEQSASWARARQRLGHRSPDLATRAGDDRGLALEIHGAILHCHILALTQRLSSVRLG